jgi:hypothetical protein
LHNVRYAKEPVAGRLAAVDEAAVGVLAFVGPARRPVACPVTPFVDGDDAVITSVLAVLGKVAAIRRDPRVALLAGGAQLRGNARVELDESGTVFRARFQAQELRKYPPSRLLLRLPFHRRLLWWYAGRAIIRLNCGIDITPGSDRITLTYLDGDGLPRVVPLTRLPRADEPLIDLRAAGVDDPPPDGPACLLVHDEFRRFRDLRQLRLSGDVADGQFVIRRRAGSLSASPRGPRATISGLHAMSKAAGTNRALLASWRDDRPGAAAAPAERHA